MGQSLVLPDLRSGRYPGFVLVVTIDGRVTAMSSDGHEERQMVLSGASGVDFVSHATMFREGVVVGGALGGRPFSLVLVYMPRQERRSYLFFRGRQRWPFGERCGSSCCLRGCRVS